MAEGRIPDFGAGYESIEETALAGTRWSAAYFFVGPVPLAHYVPGGIWQRALG